MRDWFELIAVPLIRPTYSNFFAVKTQLILSGINLLWQSVQGFFSKFLMGGGLKIFHPHRSPVGTKSDGGELAKKNRTEAQTAHLMQN